MFMLDQMIQEVFLMLRSLNVIAWRMTFLPQFKACVKAGSWSLMCAVNKINGVPACANKKLLTDILRNEWGFKGYVVTDQGVLEIIQNVQHYTISELETAALAANAGICLEDSNVANNTFTKLGDAVNNGLVSEDTLMDCASHLFMVRMKLGDFDPPEMNPYKKLSVSDIVQSKEHIQIAKDMATQSMVLLKNDESKGLPITSLYKKACVIGPFIDDPHLLYGDYSPIVMEDYVVTPLNGINSTGKIASTVTSARGCNNGPTCTNYTSSDIKEACDGADIAIACLGTGNVLELEGHDRMDINLSGSQLQLLQDVTNLVSTTILVLYNAGPLDVSWAVSSDKVVAILESFLPGQTGGSALVDVLTGVVSPAGRLPNTWPANLNQVLDITNYTMVNRTYCYFEGEPLFPFGYGLSYSTFKYSDLNIAPTTVKAGQNVTVSTTMTNTGSRTSDEVVQIYISWTNTDIAPIRQLVGAKRISLLPPSKSTDISNHEKKSYCMVFLIT